MVQWIQLRQAYTEFVSHFGAQADHMLIHRLATEEIEARAGMLEIARSTEATFTRNADHLPAWAVENAANVAEKRVVSEGAREVVVRDRAGWSYYYDFFPVEERYGELLLAPPYWNVCDPDWEDNAAIFWRLRSLNSLDKYSVRFFARKISVDGRSLRKSIAQVNLKRQSARTRRAQWIDVALALTAVMHRQSAGLNYKKELIEAAQDILQEQGKGFAERTQFDEFTKFFLSRVPGGKRFIRSNPVRRTNLDDIVRIEICACVLRGDRNAMSIVDHLRFQFERDFEHVTFDLIPFIAQTIAIVDR